MGSIYKRRETYWIKYYMPESLITKALTLLKRVMHGGFYGFVKVR